MKSPISSSKSTPGKTLILEKEFLLFLFKKNKIFTSLENMTQEEKSLTSDSNAEMLAVQEKYLAAKRAVQKRKRKKKEKAKWKYVEEEQR